MNPRANQTDNKAEEGTPSSGIPQQTGPILLGGPHLQTPEGDGY